MFLCTQPRGFRPGSAEGRPRAPLSALQTLAGKTPTAPVGARLGVGLAFLSRHTGPLSLLHGVGRMGPAAGPPGRMCYTARPVLLRLPVESKGPRQTDDPRALLQPFGGNLLRKK